MVTKMTVPPFYCLESLLKEQKAGRLDLSVTHRITWSGSKVVPEEEGAVKKMRMPSRQKRWMSALGGSQLLRPSAETLSHSTAHSSSHMEIPILSFNSQVPDLRFQLAQNPWLQMGRKAVHKFLVEWAGTTKRIYPEILLPFLPFIFLRGVTLFLLEMSTKELKNINRCASHCPF